MTNADKNMINNKSQRNRDGRINFGGSRTEKRPHQDRQHNRIQMNYNERNVSNEAGDKNLYENQRMTHAIVSLVGCTVQVLVKSGNVHEGILLTCSKSGDTVLVLACEKKDDITNKSTKESVTEKLIIKAEELVMINAKNVDLDYALKDSFTDASISKYNREVKDTEMRPLQPWESDGGDEITLEAEGVKLPNGWDAAEMFHTNATQFNVKSSYDESLEQYTTKLNKGNTEEYRRREEEAQRIAAEIVGCDQHRHDLELDNGDCDEEMAFSAVRRPSEPQSTGTNMPGKHVPTNKRSNVGDGNTSKQPRGGNVQSKFRRSPPNLHQMSSSQSIAVNGGCESPPSPHQSLSSPSVTNVVNGGSRSHPNLHQTSSSDRKQECEIKFLDDVQYDGNVDKADSCLISEANMIDKQMDNTAVNPGQELNAPLSEERHSENRYTQSSSAVTSAVEHQHEEPQHESSATKLATHSTLNPNAKVFSPKDFQQQSTQQILSPPCPQTSSTSMQHLMMNMHTQPVFPGPMQQFMPAPAVVFNGNMTQPPKQYTMIPKRAVVSVMRPEYAAQSMVQAATGQPLLAQNTQPTGLIYYQSPQQPSGYQMMPVPPPLGQNFFSPSTMQGVTPPSSMQSGGAGMDQNCAARQLFLPSQQGPMAAYLPQASHFASHPGHLTRVMPNNYNNQQLSPQTSQPMPANAVRHNYRAPSPVYTQSINQQPMNPGTYPQPSVTPQSHPGYPQVSASSPHNQTSPHNVPMYSHPSMGHPPMQQQGLSGALPFSMPLQSGIPTSIAYGVNPHTQHSAHFPHLYMMPPHPSASRPINPPHIHSSHQFPANPMAGPRFMPPQMTTQVVGGPGVPRPSYGQGSQPPNQMQFVPQDGHRGSSFQPSQ